MSNIEMIRVLSKQWANVNDIKKIASCGRDNASKVRDIIIDDIKKSGKNLPISKEKIVPMEYVIKYFSINVEHIYNIAQKEKLIKV